MMPEVGERFFGSLQQRVYPGFGCFGCGPANAHGLQLACFADGDEVVASWSPEAHHQGPPEIMHGGLIGALLDCHGAWATVNHLIRERGTVEMRPIVTASYTVHLRRPTPLETVSLRGRVMGRERGRYLVESEITAGGEVTVRYEGSYVEMQT